MKQKKKVGMVIRMNEIHVLENKVHTSYKRKQQTNPQTMKRMNHTNGMNIINEYEKIPLKK